MNEKAIMAAAAAIKSRFVEAYPDQRHMLNPTLAIELALAAFPHTHAAKPGDIVEIEVPARSSTSKDGLRYRGRLVDVPQASDELTDPFQHQLS